jgi:hypothetical protein
MIFEAKKFSTKLMSDEPILAHVKKSLCHQYRRPIGAVNGLHVWKVAANVLNKLSLTVKIGGSCSTHGRYRNEGKALENMATIIQFI